MTGSSDTNSQHATSEVVQTSGFVFLKGLTNGRKATILCILCFALFLDTFNNNSLFAAIPHISAQLGIRVSQSAWLLAAYQLTFAALLLISGRVTDLYNPKWVFTFGAIVMGIFNIAAGFIRAEIPLIIFRAIMGAGGALTIPSAQHLIVHMYPDPAEQARAIALFGAMGAVGSVFGLIIGALFVSFVSWPWVFYFSAIVSLVIAGGITVLVPNRQAGPSKESAVSKLQRLDVLGVGLFAVSLILFIFALTSGSIVGWGSAQVIAPLVISVIVMIAFFGWEAYTPETRAALPPKIWRYENVMILTIISLVPFMWWGSIFPMYAWLFETVYGWSAISTGVHFLPIAIGIIPAVAIATILQSKVPSKDIISFGFVLLLAGTVLLHWGNTKDKYWRIIFPGFVLGTAGAAFIYATTNIALLANTPSGVSGIVSALFVSVLQTGAAAGIAIVTSIQTSVEKHTAEGAMGFEGRAAGLWFLVGFDALMMLLLFIFMTRSKPTTGSPPATVRDEESASTGSSTTERAAHESQTSSEKLAMGQP
ncbi:hypothetical protein CVT24_001039 [Panaeolus cyanescens]|uniref:Major facilitator superfamily (MFS) profile domain-containing protein n=1 Tax=Panaeolus cyanescens TaxID=181874 RepID=A0A409VX18_9AGAR|nr:hypothetical protein CVT24_001039 [Panaeolus cyanescens]